MAAGKRPAEAVAAALKRLRGAFALVYLFDGEDNLLIGARQGAPLAVGYGEGEMYLGSDALALAPFTDRVAYLEEGDWVVADARGRRVPRRFGQNRQAPHRAQPGGRAAGGEGQLPPLHGQGNSRAAGSRRPYARPLHRHGRAAPAAVRLARRSQATFRASRSSAAAPPIWPASIGKYWIERFARLPVEIDVASEYRYREAPVEKGRPDDLRFAIGRNRRHAGFAALRQGAGRQDCRRRQRADVQHRAARRRRRADAWPARRSASPRPRPSPASLRRWRAWRSASRAPAARSAKPRKRRWSANSSPRPAFSPRR